MNTNIPKYRIVFFHPKISSKLRIPALLLIRDQDIYESTILEFDFRKFLTWYPKERSIIFKRELQKIKEEGSWNELPSSVGSHWRLGEIINATRTN